MTDPSAARPPRWSRLQVGLFLLMMALFGLAIGAYDPSSAPGFTALLLAGVVGLAGIGFLISAVVSRSRTT